MEPERRKKIIALVAILVFILIFPGLQMLMNHSSLSDLSWYLWGSIDSLPCQNATVYYHHVTDAGDNLVLLTDGRLAITDQAIFLRLQDGITYGFNIAPTVNVWKVSLPAEQTEDRVYRITGICREGHL